MNPSIVAVVGASGFIGSNVSKLLGSKGITVIPVKAPRLESQEFESHTRAHQLAIRQMPVDFAEKFRGAHVVVNCAGSPDASSTDMAYLLAANTILPVMVANAALQSDVCRIIHVSTAAVQGRKRTLDSREDYDLFSPYAQSKAWGEMALLELESTKIHIYRPPAVHHESRRVTRRIARLAKSPLATVASPGDAPTPQALLSNVASAIAFLVTSRQDLPPIIHHPHEGLTTTSLFLALGERKPTRLPRSVTRQVVRWGYLGGRAFPLLQANVRRAELMWFGQEQAPSWLTQAGYIPVTDIKRWKALGRRVRHEEREA